MKRLLILILSVVVMLALQACEEEETEVEVFEAVEDQFSFDELNPIQFDQVDETQTFSHLSGANIASGDYEFDEGTLRIHPRFLSSLEPGEYTLEAKMEVGSTDLRFTVLDEKNAHRIVNGGFETGDLMGWTVHTAFKEEQNLLAFTADAVRENNGFGDSAIPYQGEGDYVFGHEETAKWHERLGRMQSSAFELAGSGYITFKLGGSLNCDLAYMSVRDADTDHELARYCNEEPSTEDSGQLTPYKADLSPHLGKTLYVEFVDLGISERDYLVMDAINTYHPEAPEEGVTATNRVPEFSQPFAPNQIQNGSFDEGLDHWTTSDAPGWQGDDYQETFHVDDGMLKSDAEGNASRGLIRSSLFRIDGSGVISLELAAAQGATFDKDTFVSVRQEKTNRELYRFANVNSDGVSPVDYYIDLSEYLGETVYLEIVDNAKDDYDTIFVGNIRTYYEDRPDFSYTDTAPDLNK